MKPNSVSLRTRLLLLVLLAVLPAFAVIVYTAVSQRQDAAFAAQRDALSLVRTAGLKQSQLIGSTKQLLLSLARLPAVRQSGTGSSCNHLLGEVLRAHPYYTNFGVATVDGQIFCSALPMEQPVNIADRSYFRRAMESRDFGVGDYQTGRITGVTAINFGYPVLNEDGRLQAVVYAALSLSWLNELARGAQLPEGSVLTVVDSGGTILARHPHSEKWVGKSAQDYPFMDAVLAQGGKGTAELNGLDGVKRLYAFTPLYDGGSGSVYVSVGIPTAVAFASAHRTLARNVAFMVVAAALALIAAWVGSDVFVLRRVRALAAAARRLATGDMSARSGLPHGSEELGQLARNFDDMASALDRVNRALRTLSAGNQALVRATDERALLQEICRLIVEVGGYSLSWVAFAEKNDCKTLRPVAQTGFDGGLEALDRMLGGLTLADVRSGGDSPVSPIRPGTPCVLHDIPDTANAAQWWAEARRRGYASAVALPLHVDGQVIGALSIYSRDSGAFDAEELKLLTETAEDLAFGITTLRTRLAHQRAHETIRHMAYYDGLTGLPNHALLQERLQQAVAEASVHGGSVALLLLDIDRFREINDALGFQQGDLLLKEVGNRLHGILKETGTVARMRGDEFAVLLSESDESGAIRIATRLLSALEEPIASGGITLAFSGAVGISLFPHHSADGARLVRHADVAMQEAKKSGKHYAIYTAERDENTAERLALAGELRNAIEQEELILHYQPKVDMRDGRVCGAEALVRWSHPERGLIPPNVFIPIAEHTGLIKPVSDWVVKAALHQASDWHRAGLALPIAVNLSARNLRDAGLLGNLERLFAESGAETDWLEIELTESAVMEDPEGAMETLNSLSELGIRLFVDDFGTGYSSLAYLQKLPVNAVKIDKSFVANMLENSDSAAIVRSTIDLAHDLDLEAVAEGVENQIVWDRLAPIGCDVAQGYHIARPLPPEQFKRWLDERSGKPKPRRRAAR
ncbi:MAG TPA: EAL domain-containing protein [Gammaproteobacteria bacterium]|nr:EAL domain-containing protein [Gammaproteobacteria bacterium]